MSLEAGVLLGRDRDPIYWHLPNDRSTGYLPDNRGLWDVIWDNRANLSGFAHSHPGRGTPYPSTTDITTFSAIQKALGVALDWWIISEDRLVKVTLYVDGKSYTVESMTGWGVSWLNELRRVSYKGEL